MDQIGKMDFDPRYYPLVKTNLTLGILAVRMVNSMEDWQSIVSEKTEKQKEEYL